MAPFARRVAAVAALATLLTVLPVSPSVAAELRPPVTLSRVSGGNVTLADPTAGGAG